MPGRIIINADDFGLTPGINRAVAELHDAGVLRSATLMASGGAFHQAAAIAHDRPALGVGCHLVFVDGLPISPPAAVPSLLGPDGKSFRSSLFELARALLRGAVRPEELALETEAQIRRLQQAGIAVTHVDTHKHLHVFPALSKTVLRAAARCGVSRFRNPFEPRWSRTLSRRSATFSRYCTWELINTFSPHLQHQPPLDSEELTTSGTIGVLATGTLTPHLLRTLLSRFSIRSEQATPGIGSLIELCVHPGYVDVALDPISTRLRAARQLEISTLLEVVPELTASPGAPRLANYAMLGPGIGDHLA